MLFDTSALKALLALLLATQATAMAVPNAEGAKLPNLDKNAMWIEKYRPQSLDDVAAHKEIIDTSEPP